MRDRPPHKQTSNHAFIKGWSRSTLLPKCLPFILAIFIGEGFAQDLEVRRGVPVQQPRVTPLTIEAKVVFSGMSFNNNVDVDLVAIPPSSQGTCIHSGDRSSVDGWPIDESVACTAPYGRWTFRVVNNGDIYQPSAPSIAHRARLTVYIRVFDEQGMRMLMNSGQHDLLKDEEINFRPDFNP